MLNNIFQALDSLGLTAQKRALHILFSNQDLNTQVFLQRIDGQHQINAGVEAELICLSTNAAIPLKQFIGSQVAVLFYLVLVKSHPFLISGLAL